MHAMRTALVTAAAVTTTAALLTGAANAADWRPRPVPGSDSAVSEVVGVAADGVRTLVYPENGALMAVTSRKARWREPVAIADVPEGVDQLTASMTASGTVTVAWADSPDGDSRTWMMQRIGGTWTAPVMMTDSDVVTSISLAEHPSGTYLAVSTTTFVAGTDERSLTMWRIVNGRTVALDPPPSVGRPGSATAFASGDYVGLTWASDPNGKAMLAFLSPRTDTWGPATQVNSGNNPIAGRPVTAAGGVEPAPDGTTAVITWFQNGRDDWYAQLIRGNTLAPEVASLHDGAVGTDFEETYSAWDSSTKTGFVAAYYDVAASGHTLLGSALGSGFREPTATVHSGRIAGEPSIAVTGLGATMSWRDSSSGEVVTRSWLRRSDAWTLGAATVLGEGSAAAVVPSDVTSSVAWIARASGVRLSLDLQGPRLGRLRAGAGGQIGIRWTAPAQMAAMAYVVQVRPQGGRWVTVDRVRATRARFRGDPGVTYRVRVRALAPATTSLWSNTGSVTAR